MLILRRLFGIVSIFSGIAIINSCSVDISGAPCETDDNCPKGQYCKEGRCERGSPSDTLNIRDGLSLDTINDTISETVSDIPPEETGYDVEEITDTTISKCSTDEDCITDYGKFLCINEMCIAGECHTDNDCKAPGFPTCGENHFCISKCETSSECKEGFVCCKNQCTPGSCCEDKDCTNNGRCVNNICLSQCEENKDCTSGKCCDRQVCAAQERGCCNNSDCEMLTYGYSCINYLCSCTSDYECPPQMICDKNATPPLCKDGCSDIRRCPDEHLCCNGKCVKGECCSSDDCRRAGYPECKNINGEMRCVDTCDPESTKLCNSPDNTFRCCKHNDNIYRCTLAKCCTNKDCTEPDKPYCEMGLETPQCINKCSPPPENLSCGSDFVCCYILNDYMCFRGECCEDKDCVGDTKCIGHRCQKDDCTSNGCSNDEQCCIEGALQGICYKGECCSDSNCQNKDNGHKCLLTSFKCGCSTNGDCRSGYVCVDGSCKEGNCLTDTDCKEAQSPICINYKCSQCTQDSQCQNAQKGDICCQGECLKGDCCKSLSEDMADCKSLITKPVCKNNLCSPCSNDTECQSENLGSKCCTKGYLAGDCYNGDCCSSFDCIIAGQINKPICHTSDRLCYRCQSDTECKNEFGNQLLKCCLSTRSSVYGSCYAGDCCDNSQCSSTRTPYCRIDTHTCVECLKNSDCSTLGGYVCCNNQCIKGDCCEDRDCLKTGNGNYCYQYHCRKRCASDPNICLPVGEECCNNITTFPFPFCVPATRRCCRDNSDCPRGTQCCYGICSTVCN